MADLAALAEAYDIEVEVQAAVPARSRHGASAPPGGEDAPYWPAPEGLRAPASGPGTAVDPGPPPPGWRPPG